MKHAALPKELQIEVLSLKKAALIFRAVNNKLRLQILCFLHQNKRMTVRALYEKLQLDQPATSQHLAILRKEGFVNTEREGTNIYYSINDNRLKELNACATEVLKNK
jgi:DNA-binding transcriptional ArsR family regulator